jgi:hypothetical protein
MPPYIVAQKILDETEPEKRKDLSIQQKESYCNNLSKLLPWILDGGIEKQAIRRIEELRREIELDRIEERSNRQHQEGMEQGKKTLIVSNQTLCWSRIAAVAAVLAVIAAVVFGILQIWLQY